VRDAVFMVCFSGFVTQAKQDDVCVRVHSHCGFETWTRFHRNVGIT
jgi:hypothetical protein